MNPFEILALELKRLLTGYREESYYRSLCEFIEAYGSGKEYLHMLNITATSNPNSESIGEGIGFPDIEVRRSRRLVGYIEVKAPNENLDNPAYITQFNRYKESLENVVFTNFKKWILYTWDKDGKPQKTKEAEWDYQQDPGAEQLKKLLTVFFEGQSYQAKTPHQLAIALARKTKLLSQQVEEVLIGKTPDKMLVDLKKTFEKTLIQDIGDHQFSNIYAETIAYALFLAKLEHFEKGSNEDFTLRTAVDFLPNSVPIFKDLYQLTGGRVEPITPGIYKATEILIEQLNYADIERIYKKLVEHKPGEDPVIQFYEPFLAEYDPKEREARGVYYTPKPIVDYIVRSIDYILKNKFNKQKGLGDESVQILDPATGTGTFLMSVIQNIYSDIEKENKPLGEDLVKRKFNEVVSKHILKHLYGFELLVAPYAIAHLKLTLELERLGFDFSLTEGDQDKDNDRLKIFLANTLDDPEKPPLNLFGFESITEESEKARLVKKEVPILAIIGNPPYSKITTNLEDYMRSLTENYKYLDGKKIKERGALQLEINLNDDYIKFIAFAEKKILSNHEGVIGYITNHNYLDNPTLRGMRNQLLNNFSEIYIFNLMGNSKKKINPEDENVFNIQQGVTISFFIKKNNGTTQGRVYYSEIQGERIVKYNFLSSNYLSTTKFKEIYPKTPHYLFVERDDSKEEEFMKYFKLNELFPINSAGIITARDSLVIGDNIEELLRIANKYKNSDQSNEELSKELNISLKKGWDMRKSRDLIKKDSNLDDYMHKILYRPFDIKNIFYHNSLVWSMSQPVMRQMFFPNISIIFTRQVTGLIWNHIQVSNSLVEIKENSHDRSSQVAPLYIYSDAETRLSLFDDESIRPNINSELINEMQDLLKLNFIPYGRGDIKQNFGPEDILYYTYAILHSPTYRTRYAEQLKVDFPRVPLTLDKELFKKLVQKGNELVNLHLLGENPFDKSKTILDDTSKWDVKIAGEKPTDSDDWKVTEVRYDEKTKSVYVNSKQYFEGIEKEVWEFMIGGYQVLDKWLKDRKKAGRTLSYDDQIHYMKIIVSLRETIRIMKEIDEAIPEWPMH